MGAFDPKKKRRVDAKTGFDGLLLLLDSNREQAGMKYEQVRRRLTTYFGKRGCMEAEDLVDQTISRVTEKIVDGEKIEDIGRYWFGVARYVLMEYWAAIGKQIPSLSDLPSRREPFIDPSATEKEQEISRVEQIRNECMRRCFESLADADRKLLKKYCVKGDREQIAALFGLKLQALRVKVHRLRERLRMCLFERLREAGVDEI